MVERLQKVMAKAGIASRRKSEVLIEEGRVLVNAQRASLGMKVGEGDLIVVDGKPIKEEKKIYLLLNKPPGYLSTVKDPFKRPTVLHLLPTIHGRIYPVGRLDFNSRGLLLLTNDGALTHHLIHPHFGVSKEYHVLLQGYFHEDPSILLTGLPLDDGLAYAVKVSIISRDRERSKLKLTLKQGKKRQIRRMFTYLGYHLIDLQRTAIGPFTLKGLAEGDYRPLTLKEVRDLKKTLSLQQLNKKGSKTL